jgi:hypothetical protein
MAQVKKAVPKYMIKGEAEGKKKLSLKRSFLNFHEQRFCLPIMEKCFEASPFVAQPPQGYFI